MKYTFNLSINLGSEGMQDPAQVADALELAAQEIRNTGLDSGAVLDPILNIKVGFYSADSLINRGPNSPDTWDQPNTWR